jgi:hypothetical protein
MLVAVDMWEANKDMGSVSDPHWLYADPDPAFLDECGSGSSADPDSGKI